MYMFIIGESWCEIHKYCPNDTFLSRHLAEEYITLSGPKSSLKTSVEKMQAEHISTKEAESYGCCRMCAATESLQKTLEKQDLAGMYTLCMIALGNASRKLDSGWSCGATKREDRRIRRTAVAYRIESSAEIQAAVGTTVTQ
ncbi:fatty acid synthase [Trichonephila clavipes]|nr:fatty acid synthase [Trichonephila clavipes]